MKAYQVVTIKDGKMVREWRGVKPAKKTFKQRLLKFFGLNKESIKLIKWFFSGIALGIVGMLVGFIYLLFLSLR